MRADVAYLRLSVEHQVDHYTAVVIDRTNGVCLYRAQCTNVHAGMRVTVDFASSELGRRIVDQEVVWAVD